MERGELRTRFWSDNMKIIKHSVDSGMCGGIILKYLQGIHGVLGPIHCSFSAGTRTSFPGAVLGRA
jgi:hypothetical protein